MTIFMLQRPLLISLLLLLLVGAGCRSEEEKIQSTVLNFVESEVVYDAPYRAYVYITRADKRHTPIEQYARAMESVEDPFGEQAVVELESLEREGDQAEAVVVVQPGPEDTAEAQTRRYVLKRDDGEWRVWLGLEQLAGMRERLADARRLAEDGVIDAAKQELESVAATPFRASRPEVIEAETAAVRAELQKLERASSLDKRLSAAKEKDIDGLAQEIDALAEVIGPDEDKYLARLAELREELRQRRRQAGVEAMKVTDVRLKRLLEDGRVVREASFVASNETGRPLKSLVVAIELVNDVEGEALATQTVDCIAKGDVVRAGQEIEVDERVEQSPASWNGREVRVRVADLRFADEEEAHAVQ